MAVPGHQAEVPASQVHVGGPVGVDNGGGLQEADPDGGRIPPARCRVTPRPPPVLEEHPATDPFGGPEHRVGTRRVWDRGRVRLPGRPRQPGQPPGMVAVVMGQNHPVGPAPP